MSRRLIGALIVALGVVALFVPALRYTTEDTVVDVGPLEVTAEHERELPLWPIAGGAAVVAGLALAVSGRP